MIQSITVMEAMAIAAGVGPIIKWYWLSERLVLVGIVAQEASLSPAAAGGASRFGSFSIRSMASDFDSVRAPRSSLYRWDALAEDRVETMLVDHRLSSSREDGRWPFVFHELESRLSSLRPLRNSVHALRENSSVFASLLILAYPPRIGFAALPLPCLAAAATSLPGRRISAPAPRSSPAPGGTAPAALPVVAVVREATWFSVWAPSRMARSIVLYLMLLHRQIVLRARTAGAATVLAHPSRPPLRPGRPRLPTCGFGRAVEVADAERGKDSRGSARATNAPEADRCFPYFGFGRCIAASYRSAVECAPRRGSTQEFCRGQRVEHVAFRGAVAQLGERLNGIQEVVGSIPISSTNSRTLI